MAAVAKDDKARKGTGPPAGIAKWLLIVAMAAVGCVWLGQGLGLIRGSFMTGEPMWGIIGAGLLVGAAVLAMRRRA